jgi:hypothetical protein
LQPLSELDRLLRTCGRPAFIADPLWFIHALNGPLLNLFGIQPQREGAYFRCWEAWHVMGCKFMAHSPIREAHCSYNDYFPPAVDQFYRSISPYLFTNQARALISRLILLSNANGFRFGSWWHNSVAFRAAYAPEKLRRRVWYQDPARLFGERLVLRGVAERGEMRVVPLCADGSYAVPFWLGVWRGDDDDPISQQIIDHLHTPLDKSAVFYAADYDMHRDFHANTWPEVGLLPAP